MEITEVYEASMKRLVYQIEDVPSKILVVAPVSLEVQVVSDSAIAIKTKVVEGMEDKLEEVDKYESGKCTTC